MSKNKFRILFYRNDAPEYSRNVADKGFNGNFLRDLFSKWRGFASVPMIILKHIRLDYSSK